MLFSLGGADFASLTTPSGAGSGKDKAVDGIAVIENVLSCRERPNTVPQQDEWLFGILLFGDES